MGGVAPQWCFSFESHSGVADTDGDQALLICTAEINTRM